MATLPPDFPTGAAGIRKRLGSRLLTLGTLRLVKSSPAMARRSGRPARCQENEDSAPLTRASPPLASWLIPHRSYHALEFSCSPSRYRIDEPVTHPTDPTLVLLHGATLNSHMWDAVRRDLNPKYRVIAPDLPGHGARRAGLTERRIRQPGTDAEGFLSAAQGDRYAVLENV